MSDDKAMLYMRNKLEILRMEVKELEWKKGVCEIEIQEIESAMDAL